MTTDGGRGPDVRDGLGDLLAALPAPAVPDGFAERTAARYRSALAARRRSVRVRVAIGALAGVVIAVAAAVVFLEPSAWLPAIRLAGTFAALGRAARALIEGVPGLSILVVAASLGTSLAAAWSLYRLAGSPGRAELSTVAPRPAAGTGGA